MKLAVDLCKYDYYSRQISVRFYYHPQKKGVDPLPLGNNILKFLIPLFYIFYINFQFIILSKSNNPQSFVIVILLSPCTTKSDIEESEYKLVVCG